MSGKWALLPCWRQMVCGLKTKPKSWFTGWTFGSNFISNIYFQNCQSWSYFNDHSTLLCAMLISRNFGTIQKFISFYNYIFLLIYIHRSIGLCPTWLWVKMLNWGGTPTGDKLFQSLDVTRNNKLVTAYIRSACEVKVKVRAGVIDSIKFIVLSCST